MKKLILIFLSAFVVITPAHAMQDNKLDILAIYKKRLLEYAALNHKKTYCYDNDYHNKEKTIFYGTDEQYYISEHDFYKKVRYYINELICNGSDLNYQDQGGDTALMKALDKRNYKMAELLIHAGADLNLTDQLDDTALMYIAQEHIINEEINYIAKLLIKKGAHLDIQNTVEWTALMMATFALNMDLVKCLVHNGADMNIKDNNNYTAYDIAIQRSYHKKSQSIAAHLQNAKNYFDNGTIKIVHAYDKTMPNYFALANLKEDLADMEQILLQQKDFCIPYFDYFIEIADRLKKTKSKYLLIKIKLAAKNLLSHDALGGFNRLKNQEERDMVMQHVLKNECKKLYDIGFKFE